MKKLIYLLAMVAIVAACNKKSDNNDEPKTKTKLDLTTQTDYTAMGTIAVPAQDFKKSDVRVEATIKTGTMDINMYNVKFAEAMPVTIDMTLPNLKVNSITSEKISFSGENIVPMMANSPFEKYTTGELKGYITPDSLCFTTPFGGIATTYKGLLQKE